jgi:hypothetical protein
VDLVALPHRQTGVRVDARDIGACAPIRFWVGSHRQKPLSGHLYAHIERLLGVRFG